MRRCNYPIVILTYLSCFGFDINPTVATSYKKTPSSIKVAQADSSNTTSRSDLRTGSAGEDIKLLQIQLKKLDYYSGIPDGKFGATTRNAVIQFQQDKGLLPDGIAGSQTRKLIKKETLKPSRFISAPTPVPVSETPLDDEQESSSISDWIGLALIALGTLAGGGILFYLIQWLKYPRTLSDADTEVDDDTDLIKVPQHQLASTNQEQKYLPGNGFEVVPSAIRPSQRLLPIEKTSRLAKVNVFDELIQELHSSDLTKRRKAVWELGQKGDSRAIQPLVQQMVDADSQQRSLILAALAEIGTRTLKPMNRALAISLQDESPDVRKNAIRDLTRIYDIMAQMSQMLSMAIEDEDPEVQETARYAISQMNRIRVLPSEEPETRIQYPQEWEDTDGE